MKKQKNKVLVVGLILVVILVFISISYLKSSEQQVSMNEPVDIVSEFYIQWITELNSPDIDPYESGLSKLPILSPELIEKIKDIKMNSEDGVDPVLCQTTSDIQISTRRVYEKEDEVQILVTAKDKALTGQSVITLMKYNEGWYINDISCSPGEFAKEREFTFERDGFILKGTISDSLDSNLWYLFFEENNELGHHAPLLFGSESVCKDEKGDEVSCDQSAFVDYMKASVQGGMTERGVEVNNFMLTGE